MNNLAHKLQNRAQRKHRIRKFVSGTAERPRLSVFADVHYRREDSAARVGNIRILPVERDRVCCVREVPVAQCSAACRYCDRLIDRRVAKRFSAAESSQQC